MKRFIFISIIMLFSGCISLNNCIFSYKVEQDIIKFTQNFNINNVNKDVISNIKSGDYRFICISSMGMFMPISSSVLSTEFINLEDKLFKSYGNKCICYDDVIISEDHSRGVRIIYEYVVKYNSLLYSTLKKQPVNLGIIYKIKIYLQNHRVFFK